VIGAVLSRLQFGYPRHLSLVQAVDGQNLQKIMEVFKSVDGVQFMQRREARCPAYHQRYGVGDVRVVDEASGGAAGRGRFKAAARDGLSVQATTAIEKPTCSAMTSILR
jgi:hypothetical protein